MLPARTLRRVDPSTTAVLVGVLVGGVAGGLLAAGCGSGKAGGDGGGGGKGGAAGGQGGSGGGSGGAAGSGGGGGGAGSGGGGGGAGSGGGGSGGGAGSGGGGGAGSGGSGGGAGGGGMSWSKDLGSCPLFPADNEWNRAVDKDDVDAMSDRYMAKMNAATTKLHPDFGSDPSYGIPWATVPGTQAKVPITFKYPDSDPGPYPFPADAPIEGGAGAKGDRHVLIVDRDNCMLYETWDSHYVGPGWMCGSGAIFNLKSNALRVDGATSADAAGLPILPGLVRRDEAMAGSIKHALRFTVDNTQHAYVHPATHYASDQTDTELPPMGLRVRLKAGFDLSKFTGAPKVILTALKTYGMFLADNGSDWYISGEANTAWNDDELSPLKTVPASAFEVVKVGKIITK